MHDSVLQGLGYLKRRLRDAADATRSDPELEALAEFAAHQEQDLRDWINLEHRTAPPGFADVGSRLKETRRRVRGLEVTVHSVGDIRVPEHVAGELCAAVQQALENVARHAGTAHASCSLMWRMGAS